MLDHQVHSARQVERIVSGQPAGDGGGARLTRVLTEELQQRLSPFLVLDHFASDKPGDGIAGFPTQAQPGLEAVTYMVAGRMHHQDSAGNEGLLHSGGVQWTAASHGLVHRELPEQEEGLVEGFQLWLNLPARDRPSQPWYREIRSEEIPELITHEGALARVIAGCSHGLDGAVIRDGTQALYLDLNLPPGASFDQALPPHFHAFVYVYRESVNIEGSRVHSRQMALLDNAPSDGILLQAPASNHGPARALLIAGQPA